MRPSVLDARRRSWTTVSCTNSTNSTYVWDIESLEKRNLRRGSQVREVPVRDIIRPLEKVRSNDVEKVAALCESIKLHGLLEPIDVLEVENAATGKKTVYGFSGCHRFAAYRILSEQDTKFTKIPCRVRPATVQTLKMHMM